MRKAIGILIIVTAIPLWVPLGIWTSVRFDELQLWAPALPLWLSLGLVVLQVLLGCHVGEERKRAPQRVRWIGFYTGRVEHGTVVRELQAGLEPRPHFEIRMDEGRIIRWPKDQFTVASDGVLEYRW